MFNNKTILITGGSGSWGNELTYQLLNKYNPKEIRIYSRGEIKQWFMKRKFNNNLKLKFIVGDVRDTNRIDIALQNVDIVFHLAALKHVPICEENPNEAVLTNVVGTQNVINASIKNNVKLFVDVSSDKAVDPLNLYGVTKACGEKLTIAANNTSGTTKFVCVRGGNVIGTNGSVVPLFREQILRTNTLTITDQRMTRFFLTLKEAINLLFKAIEDSVGGEIFVLKMPSAKITDFAKVMVDELGNKDTKIKIIGIRPGEKVHEVLISRYEVNRVIETGNYYIILPLINVPAIIKKYGKMKKRKIIEYSSDSTQRLNNSEIKKMLNQEEWLSKEVTINLGLLSTLSKKELKEFSNKAKWI